jgi:AmiR/NasT family two-component response regulator
MARRGCDEATAFQLLVVLARKEQRKVRAVAADFANDAGAHPLM